MTTPPVLFVYIIDPFEYFAFINLKLKILVDQPQQQSQQSAKFKSKSGGNKTSLNSSLNNSDLNNKNTEDGIKVKDEKMEEDTYEPSKAETNNIPNDSSNEQQNDAENNDNYEAEDASGSGKEYYFNESDLKRLRMLGFFKAYMEMLNNIPDLFKYSTQFQIIPLNLCMDFQQQSTSTFKYNNYLSLGSLFLNCLVFVGLYIQSLMQPSTSSSNYSSCFSSGYGTSTSDLDNDYKLSLLKRQSFNTFALSRRYFMSPAHNYYIQLQQQQLQQTCTRAKTLTGFGPAGYEHKMLRDNLMDDLPTLTLTNKLSVNTALTLHQMKKINFYAPPYILAPSTIASATVALTASTLFYKTVEPATPAANKSAASQVQQPTSQQQGAGDCNLLMSNFIQLNMSNSSYGFQSMKILASYLLLDKKYLFLDKKVLFLD